MASSKTYYQVLGVTADVSSAEIKRAYRKLVKLQHPDIKGNGGSACAHQEATEEMMLINEAYGVLRDRQKRAEYDCLIGVTDALHRATPVFTSLEEDEQREKFLQTVFHPSRHAMSKVLGMYKRQIRQLSADPFDDDLIDQFQKYTDRIESALRRAAESFATAVVPRSLEASVQLMKIAIAQAADGLEEMRYFCRNFDDAHLTTAESLFRISLDLSRQSLHLTRGV